LGNSITYLFTTFFASLKPFITSPSPRFATIIEKFEEQKALVCKALKESEDLFGRLMQELFGRK